MTTVSSDPWTAFAAAFQVKPFGIATARFDASGNTTDGNKINDFSVAGSLAPSATLTVMQAAQAVSEVTLVAPVGNTPGTTTGKSLSGFSDAGM